MCDRDFFVQPIGKINWLTGHNYYIDMVKTFQGTTKTFIVLETTKHIDNTLRRIVICADGNKKQYGNINEEMTLKHFKTRRIIPQKRMADIYKIVAIHDGIVSIELFHMLEHSIGNHATAYMLV